MQIALRALLVWSMMLGAGERPVDPVVEERPLAAPSFTLIHTNDTRGYLEGCG